MKLADLLRDTKHGNLVLSKKELKQLNELVDILYPFAEATDLCQGDRNVTISCVVPVVLSLNRMLHEKTQSTQNFSELIKKLHAGLHERFGKMLQFQYHSSRWQPQGSWF